MQSSKHFHQQKQKKKKKVTFRKENILKPLRNLPGLATAELGGPSTMLKDFFRTDGSGRDTLIRLFCNSLYIATDRPGIAIVR